MSFAQFDFIHKKDSLDIIPIDFSCRVGGGIDKLFKFTNTNIYLDAIVEGVMSIKNNKVIYGNYQYNFIPMLQGVLEYDNYGDFTDKLIKVKYVGDYIESINPSANNRLAIGLGKNFCEKNFNNVIQQLVVKEKNILTKNDIINNIKFANDMAFTHTNYKKLSQEVSKIDTIDDLYKINEDKTHILYAWIPALIFSLFGNKVYQSCKLNTDSYKTIIMFQPLEKNNDCFIQQLTSTNNFFIEKKEFLFTKKLLAQIYGGFPWFVSYIKACKIKQLLDKESFVYEVTKKDKTDCVREIITMKNDFREEYKSRIITVDFENAKFSGKIRPFHSPNNLEVIQHCNIIKNFYIEKD